MVWVIFFTGIFLGFTLGGTLVCLLFISKTSRKIDALIQKRSEQNTAILQKAASR